MNKAIAGEGFTFQLPSIFFQLLISPDFCNYELYGHWASEWRIREIRTKGEVSPVIADGQGDTEDGEGIVRRIRESHVEREAPLLSFILAPYHDQS
jgi:hypothetical protein